MQSLLVVQVILLAPARQGRLVGHGALRRIAEALILDAAARPASPRAPLPPATATGPARAAGQVASWPRRRWAIRRGPAATGRRDLCCRRPVPFPAPPAPSWPPSYSAGVFLCSGSADQPRPTRRTTIAAGAQSRRTVERRCWVATIVSFAVKALVQTARAAVAIVCCYSNLHIQACRRHVFPENNFLLRSFGGRQMVADGKDGNVYRSRGNCARDEMSVAAATRRDSTRTGVLVTIGRLVGWAERSEPHQQHAHGDPGGARFARPTLHSE